MAITRYKGISNRYRVYTHAVKNGKSICLGMDVNDTGNAVEISNVEEFSDIRTAFGRDIEQAISHEDILYPEGPNATETIRQNFAQSSAAHNSQLYEQNSVSAANVGRNSETAREEGNENAERERQSVAEYAKTRGYTTDEWRKNSHHAPNSKDGFSSSLDNISKMFPDIYSTEAYRYYGNGTGAYESIRVIQNARNNPNAMVKIYRAVPKSVKESHVRNGDWVTLSRDYAKDHGMSNINGGYRIIEEEVPARYLYTDGNSVNEFGYDDGRAYAYSNTKNNKKLLDEVTYDDEGNPIPLSKRFDKRNKDVRYRDGEYTESIGEVNERFNEQLGTLTEKNADSIVFSLGRPSAILQSAGVENKPMKLYGNKVIKKMRKHGFALEELRDLPRAVADPIAVFNNYGEDGNRSILTELHTANGNFLVTISLGKGKDDIDFNIVSSVFGKGETNIIDWLDRGLATYINKEKALNYLHHSALHAVTSDNPRLSSAAKLVENFENPKVDGIGNSETARDGSDENAMADRVTELPESLNTPVQRVTGTGPLALIRHCDILMGQRTCPCEPYY